MTVKYHIYGIGGAIVDTEFEVSDNFLADTKIEKGVMTLVNEAQQNHLLNALISENFKLVKNCGGSVCNSVVAASNLGAKACFTGKVAEDIDGNLFISDLISTGVDFYSAGKVTGTTGKCLIMVTQDAERTMNTFLGASQILSFRDIDTESLKNSNWLYVEGYLLTDKIRTEVIKEAVDFAKRNGVKIAISLSDPNVVALFGDALRDVMAGGVDLILCNKDEAKAFTGADDLESVIEKLKLITNSFAITDGANGAVIFDGQSLLMADGIPVKAIDTNGAGDMFAGAFLYAITSGKRYDWALKLANYCASRVVTQFGPRLALDEYSVIKEKFGI